MKGIILVLGLIAWLASGVISLIGGIVLLIDGQVGSGIAAIFLGAPMSFSVMIVIHYVGMQVEAEEEEAQKKAKAAAADSDLDSDSESSTPPLPNSDTAGTPWATDPGHKD